MPKNINAIRVLGNWTPLKIKFSSYQGDQILAITSSNSIGTYNLNTKKQQFNAAVMQGDGQKVEGQYYINQTGKYLYTVSEGCLVGWKIQQNTPNGFMHCGDGKLGLEEGNNIKIARHQQVMAVTDWKSLKFWNLTSGQQIASNVLQSEHKKIIFLDFSKDGKVLFLCNQEGKLYIFNNNSPYFSLFKIKDLQQSIQKESGNFNGNNPTNMTFLSIDTIVKEEKRNQFRYIISLVHSDQKQAIYVHNFDDPEQKVLMKSQPLNHRPSILQTIKFITANSFVYQNSTQLQLYQLDYEKRTIVPVESQSLGKVPIAMAYQQQKSRVALGLNNGQLHIYEIGLQESDLSLGLSLGLSFFVILVIIATILIRRHLRNRSIKIEQVDIPKTQTNSLYDMVENKSMDFSQAKNEDQEN